MVDNLRSSVRRTVAGPPTPGARPNNRLLASLPAEDFQRISVDLKTVPLTAKQLLFRRDDPIHDVYFPNGGVCSITSIMKNGAAVEVATVGDEGMVGIAAFFGGHVVVGESMVQVAAKNGTTAERMSLEAFRRQLDEHGALRDALARYSQAIIALMMQSTACMALHRVHERCCRWLLMTHDRVRVDTFGLSHEFLAVMLGSTRPTVTMVAGVLQKAGLIRSTHGTITILDRSGLEAASCECYATVKREFDRLGI
jgi:CRP-like cAMP-binding protein